MEKIEAIKEKIIPILKENDVKRSSIFGSVARGEETADSDVDVLVEFEKSKTLFDLVRLERRLGEALGRKVDLLTYNSVNPKIKPYIINDEIKIYG